jgi:adenine-specific DNA-methyltransferase
LLFKDSFSAKQTKENAHITLDRKRKGDQPSPRRSVQSTWSINMVLTMETWEARKHRNGNKIIHGDNLEALKALLPEYEGRIKCIYIDPPYNTGNEGWVYNDNVSDPKIKKWLHELVGKEGEDLSRHDKWLCMMYPRLKLLHKLLADDGAIFISIDDNEHTFLKLICDEIFGNRNYVSSFIWRRRASSQMSQNNISVDHEYVVTYFKSPDSKFYGVKKDYKNYSNPDDDPRGDWTLGDLTVGMTKDQRPNQYFDLLIPKPGVYLRQIQNESGLMLQIL